MRLDKFVCMQQETGTPQSCFQSHVPRRTGEGADVACFRTLSQRCPCTRLSRNATDPTKNWATAFAVFHVAVSERFERSQWNTHHAENPIGLVDTATSAHLGKGILPQFSSKPPVQTC